MKKDFIDNMVKLINCEKQEERVELQIKLHHIITTSKLSFNDISFENIAKIDLINDIKKFVENPNSVNKDNLTIQLLGFPKLMLD